MLKRVLISAARVIAIVAMLGLLVGTGCINSLMFHPVKGRYDGNTPGYVDIGTNGVRIAAIVLGPEHGSPPSQELRRGKPPSQELRRGKPPSQELRRGSPPSQELRRGSPPSQELRRGSPPSQELRRGKPPSQELRRGRKAIIRCHGNAEDALGTLWALKTLAAQGYTVAAVEYPGYGLSDGSPDEEGCYRNVHRLYDWLVETRGFKPEDIIVDGFSIGTGPATELAATRPCGGLILEAPFLSAPRVVTRVRILPVDPFPNLKRIVNVKCPVLMIHGTKDSIIPYSQGKSLFKLANEPKRFVTVEGGDHNTIVDNLGRAEYVKLIKDFVDGVGLVAKEPKCEMPAALKHGDE